MMQLLFLFFYLSTSNIVVSAGTIKPMSYANILSNILIGNISTNNNLSALVNYTAIHPHECTLNLSFASINNGEVIKDAVTLYEYAILGEKWGDALFFKHFILYNGQAHVYINSTDLKYDLAKLMNGNETMRKIWVESSSSDQLKELYRSIDPIVPQENVFYVPDSADYHETDTLENDNCQRLLIDLNNEVRTVNNSSQEYCVGPCCINWIKKSNILFSCHTGILEWRINTCIVGNASCQISGIKHGTGSFRYCSNEFSNGYI